MAAARAAAQEDYGIDPGGSAASVPEDARRVETDPAAAASYLVDPAVFFDVLPGVDFRSAAHHVTAVDNDMPGVGVDRDEGVSSDLPGTLDLMTESAPATSGRPLWLLDFDGVVNALSVKPDRAVWRDWERTELTDVRGQTYPILWSPTVVQAVWDAVRDGVEVVWLSTWFQDTQQFPAALGLPALPWLPGTAHAGRPWWKLPLAQAAAGDRPLLWTDDDLHLSLEAQRWVQTRRAATLPVAPSDRIGLSPKKLRAVREFWLRHLEGAST